ncbi:MAG: YncE family protein [Nitrososphaerales archaeon]
MAACLLLSSTFLGLASSSARATPILSSIPVGTVPRGVAVDPNNGLVYTLLFLNGTTLAVDPQTSTTSAEIPTPSPYAVAVDPQTGRVYVSQGQGASVSVIGDSSNTVVGNIDGTGTPYALAVDQPDDLLFCVDTSNETLFIANGLTNGVVAHVPIGSSLALAVDPAAHEAFVGNLSSDLQSGAVEVVSTTSLSIIHSIPLPFAPGRFAVDPVSHLLFVTAQDGGSGVDFLAINDSTFQTVYSLHLGGGPNLLAVDSSSDVYVSAVGNNRLYELQGATGAVLLNSTGNDGITFTGITGMAFDARIGSLFITENDVTNLIALATNSTAPSSSSTLSSTSSSSGSSTLASSSSSTSSSSGSSTLASSSSSSSSSSSYATQAAYGLVTVPVLAALAALLFGPRRIRV